MQPCPNQRCNLAAGVLDLYNRSLYGSWMCRITPFGNPTERRAAVKYLLTLLAVLLLLAAETVFAEDAYVDQQEAKHLGSLRQVTFGLPRAGE